MITEANVNKILIDNQKASGVEYIDAEGQSHILSASKEVLLCSGAFGSPQILLRSGVGPKEEIEKHGIEHKVDLPGVGKNLQDHIDYLTVHKYNSAVYRYLHKSIPNKISHRGTQVHIKENRIIYFHRC